MQLGAAMLQADRLDVGPSETGTQGKTALWEVPTSPPPAAENVA
jgi:hypothetical protein